MVHEVRGSLSALSPHFDAESLSRHVGVNKNIFLRVSFSKSFPEHACVDAAPTPTGFAEIVSDDFPVPHAGETLTLPFWGSRKPQLLGKQSFLVAMKLGTNPDRSNEASDTRKQEPPLVSISRNRWSQSAFMDNRSWSDPFSASSLVVGRV
jgi:hypothetical protein